LQIKGKKNQASCADKNVVLQFLPPTKFLPILSSLNFLILAPFPFHPWSKKGFKLACNLSSNFKHLAIVSLQTRAKILLTTRIPAFTLDIQTGIS
jgi:hypothetical protein